MPRFRFTVCLPLRRADAYHLVDAQALKCRDEGTASHEHGSELAALRTADGPCGAITGRAEAAF
jgi:hypothetical protein